MRNVLKKGCIRENVIENVLERVRRSLSERVCLTEFLIVFERGFARVLESI